MARRPKNPDMPIRQQVKEAERRRIERGEIQVSRWVPNTPDCLRRLNELVQQLRDETGIGPTSRQSRFKL